MTIMITERGRDVALKNNPHAPNITICSIETAER
jgi:hypothetical protein